MTTNLDTAAVQSVVVAILTGATCGGACWEARENVCHCRCGGVNHGINRTANGTQPRRTRRVKADWYVLAGVGTYSEQDRQTREIATAARTAGLPGESYSVRHNAWVNRPAFAGHATAAQLAAWPELAAARAYAGPPYATPDYLLWVRQDVAAALDI